MDDDNGFWVDTVQLGASAPVYLVIGPAGETVSDHVSAIKAAAKARRLNRRRNRVEKID